MQNRLNLLAIDLPSFPEDYLVLTMLRPFSQQSFWPRKCSVDMSTLHHAFWLSINVINYQFQYGCWEKGSFR